MKPSEINKIVKNVFGTNPERGEQIYNFLIENKLKKCLELGFANGVSTTWIAGAIHEMGDGNVVSVDTNAAKQRNPSAEQLISQASLNNIANLH